MGSACASPTCPVSSSPRATRSYLFVLEHDQPTAQVLLRAYGAQGEGIEAGVTGFGYVWPSFDTSGQKVLVTQEDPGDHYTYASLVIYNTATRSFVWNSFALAAQSRLLVAVEPSGAKTSLKRFYGAALSPDGNHVLCEAVTTAESSDAVYAQADLKHYLVHFDLQKQSVQVLASFERDITGTVWHPNSRHFALSASNGDDQADIYSGEVGGQLRRLTHSPSRDFNPLWNGSGTRLFWLSNRTARTRKPQPKPKFKLRRTAKPLAYRLFSMKPNGSGQRAELPAITSVDSLRWAASLPSWRRYREK